MTLNPQPEGIKQAINLLKEEVRKYLTKHPGSIAAVMDRDLGVYARGGWLLWSILEMMEADGEVKSERTKGRRYFSLTKAG